MTDDALLTVTDLQIRYGPALALDGVSLSVPAGRVLAVVGANGAGKSTLARAISGLVPVTSGTIEFDGTDVTKRAAHSVRRDGLVYLPEGRGIFPSLSVTENLRMAACLLPRGQRKDAVDRGRELFPSLARRASTAAGKLSGGEQQMLSLARALVLSPKLIIADEMSLGLAPQLVDQVFEAITTMRATGVTIILIEQFVHRALDMCDAAVLLTRGQVNWSGPRDVARHEIVQRYLGEDAA